MDSDAPKMRIRKPIILAGILVVLSFLFRIIFSSTEVIYPDACTYLSISKSILNGKLYTDFREGTDIMLPPLYPLLSSAAWFVFRSFELSAIVVSLLMGALLIIPVYYLARVVYGEKAGWISVLFIFFSPVMINWSVAMYTEALFILLFISAITAGLYAIEKEKGILFFSAGVLTGLAYMTRIPGIIVLAILGFWTIIHFIVNNGYYKKMASMLIALALGFIIVTAPYFVYMHSFLGEWSLTASYGSIKDVVVEEGIETVAGWELLEVKESKKSFPEMFAHKLTVNLRHYSYMLFRMLTVAGLFAIIGIKGLRRGLKWDGSFRILFLLSFIVIYFSSLLLLPPSPLIDERMRYLSPVLPLLLILSAGGVVSVAGWLSNHIRDRIAVRLAGAVIILIALLSFIPQYSIVSAGLSKPWQEKPPVDIRKMTGEWMQENLPRPIRVMSRAPFIPYHAGGIFFLSPPTYERVIKTASQNKIDYIVVDRDVDYSLRPKLQFLFNPRIVPKEFKLVGGFTHPDTGEILTAVYRIER